MLPAGLSMRTDTASHVRLVLHRAVVAACALCIASGLLVLFGWQFNIEFLKSLLHPGRTAMNPVSALAFIAAGVSLGIQHREGNSPRRRSIGLACGAFIVIVAILRLAAYYTAWDFSIDRTLFTNRLGQNQMAPNTAVTFLLAGL